MYPDNISIKEKILVLAKEIYRANGVIYTKEAEKALENIKKLGKENLPVCIAKTQYSLSDDPTKLGVPRDFNITVRDVSLSNGAEFIVVITGNILRMPGLPKKPAAEKIDITSAGKIKNMF